MSNLSSPSRYDSDNHLYDLEDRIRSPISMNYHGHSNSHRPMESEKLDMFVPDRILVAGEGQYIGTTAPPRELRLENIVRPPDPGMVRVETPPRVISLSEHRFPTVGEDDDDDDVSDPESLPPPQLTFARAMATPKKSKALVPSNDIEWTPMSALNGSDLAPKGLPPGEEVTHLRRQMAKLNRRLMAIELENLQRQQRDKIILVAGLGYFLIKFLRFLNK